MSALIPPLSINISGNKCGGCCGRSRIRGEEPPSHYYVIYGSNKNLVAVSPTVMSLSDEAKIAHNVYQHIREQLRKSYSVELEDLPLPARPLNLSRVPSVDQIKRIEAVAIGYKEGVKRGQESVCNESTPKLKRSSDGSTNAQSEEDER